MYDKIYDNTKNIGISKNYKNGIKYIKKNSNNYHFTFTLENKNYILLNIVDFELINLIYKLNGDIYESIHTEKINDSEMNITLVIKKIFFDFITQKYAFLNIKKEIRENAIIFNSKIITTHKPSHVKDNLDLVNVESIINKFEFVDNHTINCNFEFIFTNSTSTNPIFDKVFVNMINKMFVRFKNFIEDLK
jgi:hypothetical protein